MSETKESKKEERLAGFRKGLESLMEEHKVGITGIPKYAMHPEGHWATVVDLQFVDLESLPKKEEKGEIIKPA